MFKTHLIICNYLHAVNQADGVEALAGSCSPTFNFVPAPAKASTPDSLADGVEALAGSCSPTFNFVPAPG